LRDFLPDRLIDVHAHVWRAWAGPARTGESRTASWPERVADRCSVVELAETYRRLLPGKSVTPLVFGNPTSPEDLESQNAYVGAAAVGSLPALALTRPDWPAEKFEQTVADAGLAGAKPYLTYAPGHLAAREIRIFDFLPPAHLDVLNRRRWIVILHVPRPGRLGDAQNVADLLEIDRRWPEAQVVVAHVGRAYCIEDLGDAMAALSRTRHLRFDISANTNEEVFHRLLLAVGPPRVLFGSDLPITRMRMRRITRAGRYVNLIPRGLYGDVSSDPHMRELDGAEAEGLTLFLYEELDAFRRAAERAGLSAADIQAVFHDNARRMLDGSEEHP